MRRFLALTLALLAAALVGATAAAPAAFGQPQRPPSSPLVERSWPLTRHPVVVDGFRPPPRDWLPGHRGVDLVAEVGEPVLSPISGTVVFAAEVVDRPAVVIAVGDLRVSLEPVAATTPVGAAVTAGQPIGRITAGRSHCAPVVCLHWGLRQGDGYRNPLLLVLRGQPVLLPHDGDTGSG